jgi:N-acetyl-gamma-glutamyl-phosphate reductase
MVNKYSDPKTPKISTSIVGARGYSGLELAKLLLKHPAVKLETAFATREFSLEKELMLDEAATVGCFTDEQMDGRLADIVFLATPNEVSAELAPKLVKQGKTVIDLSGAFRCHTPSVDASLQSSDIQYGLVPFCGPKKNVKLISNPGCYATAVQMALIPLLKHNVIETDSIAIDAKSGTTGAGRKAAENQLFAEVDQECLPYRVGVHQHLPEITKYIEQYAGAAIEPHFVTHLLPVKRGIECAVFATSKTTNIKDITAAFAAEYSSYPLVKFGEDYARLAKLSHVVNTPYTHISYQLVGKKLYVFSVLDNLMKGAASQAVENLNRLLDLPVTYSMKEA